MKILNIIIWDQMWLKLRRKQIGKEMIESIDKHIKVMRFIKHTLHCLLLPYRSMMFVTDFFLIIFSLFPGLDNYYSSVFKFIDSFSVINNLLSDPSSNFFKKIFRHCIFSILEFQFDFFLYSSILLVRLPIY